MNTSLFFVCVHDNVVIGVILNKQTMWRAEDTNDLSNLARNRLFLDVF